MSLRRIEIALPSPRGERREVTAEVYDDLLIGPFASTLAAQWGYPSVDHLGAPLIYQLRLATQAEALPPTVSFGDAGVPSGCCVVLEAALTNNATVPLPECTHSVSSDQMTPAPGRFPRRLLFMAGGSLLLCGLLGLGAGAMTGVVQQVVGKSRVRVAGTSAGGVLSSGPPSLTLQSTFTGHQHTVRTTGWSHDGTRLASGGDDARVVIWQPDTTVLHAITLPDRLQALAWSPITAQLALGVTNRVSFLDGQTGSLLASDSLHHTDTVTALAWAWTRRGIWVVSAGRDARAWVWNGQTYQALLSFEKHTTPLEAIAVLSTTAATASQGGVVRLWNILSGKEIHGYFSDTTQGQRAVSFSSTGPLATGADDGVVRLWNNGRACTQELQDAFGMHCIDRPLQLHGHVQAVWAIAFSPDGLYLATGADDGKLIIWSMQTLAPLLMQQMPEPVLSLSWSPFGQSLAVATGARVTIWRFHHP